MKPLCDLFGQLYEARVFSEMIHDLVIFQKSVFGFSLQLFSILDYILQSDRYLVSGILKVFFIMLSIIGIFFIFSILVYSRRAIKYAVQLEFYCKAVLSGQYYSTSFEDYTAGSAEEIYILIVVQSN